MNQKNFENLDNQIFYTGFGDGLKNDLKEAMQTNQRESFTLKFKNNFGEDTVEGKLNFKKSKQSDYYFYNSFDMAVKNGTLEKVKSQNFKVDSTFYRDENGDPAGKWPNITQKEAYNLMCGRAIKKDLVSKVGDVNEWRNAWVQMDFSESDRNGNFKRAEFPEYNLESQLNKLPMKELANDDYKANLIDSLERGNRQLITLEIDQKDLLHYIEANPKFDTLLIYDENMKRTNVALNEGQGQSQDQNNSQTMASDDGLSSENAQQNEATVRNSAETSNTQKNEQVKNVSKDISEKPKVESSKSKSRSRSI